MHSVSNPSSLALNMRECYSVDDEEGAAARPTWSQQTDRPAEPQQAQGRLAGEYRQSGTGCQAAWRCYVHQRATRGDYLTEIVAILAKRLHTLPYRLISVSPALVV